ncbi:MAG: AAA family ATPase [Bacteriovoracia bacterium]
MEVIGQHDKLNDAEQKILSWLEEGLRGVEGRILIEPGFRRTKYQLWPDFVVLSPTHGVLIIECKGHYSEEIRKVSNTDLMTARGVDRYGKQMASYGCLFRELLSGLNVPFSKFVIFPNILKSDRAAEYISEFNTKYDDVRVLFHEDLDWPCSLEYLGLTHLDHKLKRAEFDELLDLINPTRVISHEYTIDLNGIHDKLMLLDQNQSQILDKMTEGHYLLNGLPGTGKTIMLMQLAERELNKNKVVLYTCYNRPLNDYVSTTLGGKVAKTASSLYFKLALKLGAEESTLYKSYDSSLKYLLSQKLDPIFDVILVDEYQDLEDDDYHILTQLLKEDGLMVLGGDRLQNIRSNKETWKSKGIKIIGQRSKFLKRPYRAHPEVVDFAISYLCKNPILEKEAKRYFSDNDFKHVEGNSQSLNERLKFLIYSADEAEIEINKIKQANPNGQILIITPDPDYNKALAKHRAPNVRVETFLRAKGLEADIVILYAIDKYRYTTNETLNLSEQQKIRSIFSALCRSRGDTYIHAFEPKDYFKDLKDVYNLLVKKNGNFKQLLRKIVG